MTKQEELFIRQNRLKMSVANMADSLGVTIYKVRRYMIDNDLMKTPEEMQRIRISSLKPRVKKENRPWNWDALP